MTYRDLVEAWVSAVVAVGCLLVGGIHLARSLVVSGDHRMVEISSAAMGLAMAGMFSPLGDPVPRPVWTAVFLAGAAWAALLAVRARTIGGDAGHHLVCSGAMIFMVVGHESHGAGGLGVMSVAALVLAGYFAWHVFRCVERLRGAVGGPRAAATAHLAMTVTMSGMLVAMM